jgi:LacI family transcriptional regulator
LVTRLDRRRKYNQLVQNLNAAGHMVGDMLFKQGHRRIVCAGGGTTIRNYKFDGIVEVFQGHNLKCTIVPDDSALGNSPDYRAIGRQLVNKILALPELPTAIVFSNDERALGGMCALLKAGYVIPEDFSIVGFDNIPGSELFHPALTTVESGYTSGVDATVKMITEQKMGGFYVLPQELIIRESTCSKLAKKACGNKVKKQYTEIPVPV